MNTWLPWTLTCGFLRSLCALKNDKPHLRRLSNPCGSLAAPGESTPQIKQTARLRKPHAAPEATQRPRGDGHLAWP